MTFRGIMQTMRRLNRNILIVAAATFFPFLAIGALAQNESEPFRSWMEEQRQSIERITSFQVNETVLHTMDGGFGKQALRTQARLRGGPDADPPGRTIIRMELNGREVSPEHGERVRRQQRSMFRTEIGRVFESFRFPVQDFSRMQMTRQMTEDELHGVPVWRVDAAPRTRSNPVERMTAWFDAETFQLLATQTLMHTRGGQPVRVRSTYQRIDGIDLPLQRVLEGSSAVRRRMRLFTVLFERTIDFSNYQLEFAE